MNESDRFGKWYEGECFLVPPESRIVWLARARIARQDEKELLEALINVCRKLDIDDITDKRTIAEEELFIQITSVIEKHKGKTWEEIVEDSDG